MTTPWVSSPGELRAAASFGSMPILAPASAERRRRWQEVVEWYGPQEASIPRPDDGGHLVLGLGKEAAPVAELLATALGREPASASSRGEAEGALRCARPRSALLVAPARSLRGEELLRLAIASDRAGVALGILTGKDLPGLTFSAAKAVLAWRTRDSERDLTVDALAGEATGKGSLGNSMRSLLVLAHGDGAHLDLGNLVLCGASGGEELSAGSVPLPGCGDGHCKKTAARSGVRPLPLRDLRARLAVLATCNGSVVAGDLYPSDVSLVLAGSEGFPAAVLTTLGQTALDPRAARGFAELLDGGEPLASLASLLGATSLAGAQLPAQLLWGDPLWSPAGDSRAPRTRSRPAPRRRDDPPPSRLEEIARRRRQLRFAEGLEQGIAVIAADRVGAEPQLATRLAALSQARRMAQSRLWIAARWAKLDAEDGASAQSALAQMGTAAARWDEICAELIALHLLDESAAGAGVGDMLLPALHAFHRMSGSEEDGVCARCATTVFRQTAVAPEVGLPARVLRVCATCGPLAEHGLGAPATSLTIASLGDRGGRAELRLRRGCGGESPLWVAVQMRDKSKPSPFFSTRERQRLDPELAVRVPIPADAGYDLYSARAVVIDDMDLSFARAVSALVPAGP